MQTLIQPDYESAAAQSHRRRGLLFIALAVAAVGFAMNIQGGLNANFIVEELRLTGFQQGLLEAFRESCGILALVVVAALSGFAEPLVAAAMLILVAIGLGAYAYVPSYFWLVATSLIWSQGLHVWMPLPNSMTLALSEPNRAGHRLGQIGAAGAAGSGAGLIAALSLHLMGVSIRPMYLLAGAVAVLAALACLGIPREIKTTGPGLVIRRRYGLYYLLCFLEGWRKQIFIAFAGYLLVKQHGTPLRTMLLLYLAIQPINWLISPIVGRMIDRVGERRVLAFYYATMTMVFIGYAFIPNRHVLYALFVMDSCFFTLGMALTTYVNRIAPPSEHTPTLSMGVAMNHVAAVTMPFVGGLLWRSVGPVWVFLIGAVTAALSILVALRVPLRQAAMPQSMEALPAESVG